MNNISFIDTAPDINKIKVGDETVFIITTVNRVCEISVKHGHLLVLWVKLKDIYSTSWCRLV